LRDPDCLHFQGEVHYTGHWLITSPFERVSIKPYSQLTSTLSLPNLWTHLWRGNVEIKM